MFATMTANLHMPEEGFTLDDLKAALRKVRAPNDCKIKPAIVDNMMDPEAGREVLFVVEWRV